MWKFKTKLIKLVFIPSDGHSRLRRLSCGREELPQLLSHSPSPKCLDIKGETYFTGIHFMVTSKTGKTEVVRILVAKVGITLPTLLEVRGGHCTMALLTNTYKTPINKW
jgi:hypothetical protein